MEDVEECEEALDKDYLKVVRTDVRNANPTREWRDTAIRSVREKVLRLIGTMAIFQTHMTASN